LIGSGFAAAVLPAGSIHRLLAVLEDSRLATASVPLKPPTSVVKVSNWRDYNVTVKTVVPLNPLNVAEMVVVPVPTASARPRELEALEMVATAVLDEAQVTCLVMFFVEPPS
jgi:hypothetical protein